MTLAPDAAELLRRVRSAAEGTPYVVTETDDGFDVGLDIADARWFGLFNRAALKKTFIHHVRFPKPGVFTITDDSREVTWVAGVPELRFGGERQYGRVIELGARKIWAFDEHGRFGVVADYRFNSEEGRQLVTTLAEQLGLQQRRGTAERIGLYVGVFALVGAVVTVIVNVVALLTGYYG